MKNFLLKITYEVREIEEEEDLIQRCQLKAEKSTFETRMEKLFFHFLSSQFFARMNPGNRLLEYRVIKRAKKKKKKKKKKIVFEDGETISASGDREWKNDNDSHTQREIDRERGEKYFCLETLNNAEFLARDKKLAKSLNSFHAQISSLSQHVRKRF